MLGSYHHFIIVSFITTILIFFVENLVNRRRCFTVSEKNYKSKYKQTDLFANGWEINFYGDTVRGKLDRIIELLEKVVK